MSQKSKQYYTKYQIVKDFYYFCIKQSNILNIKVPNNNIDIIVAKRVRKDIPTIKDLEQLSVAIVKERSKQISEQMMEVLGDNTKEKLEESDKLDELEELYQGIIDNYSEEIDKSFIQELEIIKNYFIRVNQK